MRPPVAPTRNLHHAPKLGHRLAVGAAIAVLTALALWPTPGCGFVFDDVPLLVDNMAVTSADWLGALFGRDRTLANRPLTAFLLALQWGWFGDAAVGYRWVSVLLHLACARVLFLVVRDAWLAPNLAGSCSRRRAFWLAAAVSGLFAVHPLGVDVIAYSVQQSMLAMALCLLLALRLLQNAHAHASPRLLWWAAAMVALGMACKEEMAPAPLLLVLYQRAFLVADWRSLRPHLPFHLALAASWLVLAYCVLAGPPNTTVGWHTSPPITAWEWLQTQSAVVLHYARLSLWPWPLRAVYDTGIERDVANALLPGATVLLLVGTTVVLWCRRPPLGFLGAWFFLLLAPTSSILPILTEVVAERRAFVSRLSILVPLVLALERATAGLPARVAVRWLLAVGLATLAVLGTRSHVRVFADDTALWTHARASNELTNGSFAAATILSANGKIANDQGRRDEAFALFERAMQTVAQPDSARLNWATALRERGLADEAERVLRRLVDERPDSGAALDALAAVRWQQFAAADDGSPAADDRRLVEVEQLAQRARQHHATPQGANTLATVQYRRGRAANAEDTLRRAIAQWPQALQLHKNLGSVLLLTGKPDEAKARLRPLLPLLPGDVGVRLNLVQALLQTGGAIEATAVLEEVLRIDARNATARALLEQIRSGG